ncbi:MAG: penicillin-binding protein 2 [Candidatus Tectomicrobia bacterium]|nr:penicillin-binding protein 2 [Candidatus Tectomicrobia bacterium]
MKSLEGFRRRQRLLLVLLLLGLGMVAARLYQLQATPSSLALSRARRQYAKRVPIQPQRGTLMDQRGRTLALSVQADSIFVRPAALVRPTVAVRLLSQALSLPERDLRQRLSSGKPFVWLRRQAGPDEARRVRDLDLPGVATLPEGKRYYPKGRLGGQLLGFVGVDNAGLEGLEYALDPYLRGVPGTVEVSRDGRGRSLYPLELLGRPPRKGADVVLTLDEAIQHFAESALDRAVASSRARGGTALVLEPETGRVLALAVSPPFDPNQYLQRAPEDWRLNGVTTVFEPGSTFKLVTMAAYIEAARGAPGDTFDCRKGRSQLAGRRVRDVHPYGVLSVAQVFAVSSNICTIQIAQAVGERALHRYIQLLGFGDSTRSRLPAEPTGLVRPPEKWTSGSIVAVPIGQEVSVTALQMALAYGAVANGGYLMRPRLVREIRDGDEVVRVFAPKIRRRVLQPRTARILKEMLAGVVQRGTGKAAKPRGYSAAGKTGTAQQVDPATGTYSEDHYVASFVGFAPVETPRVVIFVSIDYPRTHTYGGVVAAPVFREIAGRTLRYLRVPPDEKPPLRAARQGEGTARRRT